MGGREGEGGGVSLGLDLESGRGEGDSGSGSVAVHEKQGPSTDYLIWGKFIRNGNRRNLVGACPWAIKGGPDG